MIYMAKYKETMKEMRIRDQEAHIKYLVGRRDNTTREIKSLRKRGKQSEKLILSRNELNKALASNRRRLKRLRGRR